MWKEIEPMNILRSTLLLIFVVTFAAGAARAQVDLSGMWSPVGGRVEENDNPPIGHFAGMPLNHADQLRGASYDPNMFDVAENVCRPYPPDMPFGPAQLRISSEVDKTTQQIIAYHLHFFYHEQEYTIWMDGRPHPPDYALHTWGGFSTGEWQGNTLVITTTHLKESYILPNGPARSDRATLHTHLRRYGNYLTGYVIVYDPTYLAEPYIRPASWVYDPSLQMPPYPCEEATETVIPRGKVPHYLPGRNPLLTDFAAQHGIPPEAELGGAETMYPDYIGRMKKMKLLPHPEKKPDSSVPAK
jgi:hypothetical protein